MITISSIMLAATGFYLMEANINRGGVPVTIAGINLSQYVAVTYIATATILMLTHG